MNVRLSSLTRDPPDPNSDDWIEIMKQVGGFKQNTLAFTTPWFIYLPPSPVGSGGGSGRRKNAGVSGWRNRKTAEENHVHEHKAGHSRSHKRCVLFEFKLVYYLQWAVELVCFSRLSYHPSVKTNTSNFQSPEFGDTIFFDADELQADFFYLYWPPYPNFQVAVPTVGNPAGPKRRLSMAGRKGGHLSHCCSCWDLNNAGSTLSEPEGDSLYGIRRLQPT